MLGRSTGPVSGVSSGLSLPRFYYMLLFLSLFICFLTPAYFASRSGWSITSPSLPQRYRDTLYGKLNLTSHLGSPWDFKAGDLIDPKYVNFNRINPIMAPYFAMDYYDMIIMILSTPKSTMKRQQIRDYLSTIPQTNLTRFCFLVGDDMRYIESLKQEHNTHGDMLVLSMIDTYRNLTTKVIGGFSALQGLTTFGFVLKFDHDVFADVHKIYSELTAFNYSESERSRLIWGYISLKPESPHRHGKYYISPADYPEEKFPLYPRGTTYVIGRSIAAWVVDIAYRRVFPSSLYTGLLWLEDVNIGHLSRFMPGGNVIRSDSRMQYPRRDCNSLCNSDTDFLSAHGCWCPDEWNKRL